MSPLWLLLLAPALAVAQQPQPNPCFRWSGQVAIANSPGGGNLTSTLYYQGGQARTTQDQAAGTWTNALVSLDLSTSWNTGSPPTRLVQADNGNYSSPPAVALGALYASADGSKLFQYAGQFSDTPAVAPPAQAVWQYTIGTGTWEEVQTLGDEVTRPAEGSAAIVPNQGTGDNMAYYFSGHLDSHTVQGWSNQIARVYLSSLVTFDLGSLTMRNITSYASDASTSETSTPEINPVYRADGTLSYVPGLGTDGKGILVAIGGATSTQYVDNSVLDVFDIGKGGWTKQATLGDTIGSRVNHCAVRASAKVDGILTHQIFIYGGQKLNQTSRDSAVYILTIPSYTWTFVGDSLPGQPSGRAGHQCALQGSQLIVMGGLVSSDLICDQPGLYVYDVSKSAWQNSYTTGTTYSTPALISNITGGIGTGTSSSGAGSSTGGDGSADPDTSNSNGEGQLGEGSGSKKSSSLGAIIGGVVGAIIALLLLLLLLLLLMRRRKRQRQVDAAAAARDKRGEVGRGDSEESAEGLRGFAYEKTTSSSGYGSNSPYGRASGSNDHAYASDDVEEETRGMEAAFGSHLVPKQTLRVTNPERDD